MVDAPLLRCLLWRVLVAQLDIWLRWTRLDDVLPTVSRSTIAAHDYRTRVQGVFPGSVGPAFAHGCHDLGELSVERVKLLSFGSARDEGVPVAGYAPAPYPLNGARRGDVRQRVTGHEDQVRVLPGGDTSSVGEAEHSCRFSRGSGQGLRRADAAPDKEFELSVQACSEHGPRVRSIRARQQSDHRIGQSSHVVLGPRVGRHLPAMRLRLRRTRCLPELLDRPRRHVTYLGGSGARVPLRGLWRCAG